MLMLSWEEFVLLADISQAKLAQSESFGLLLYWQFPSKLSLLKLNWIPKDSQDITGILRNKIIRKSLE